MVSDVSHDFKTLVLELNNAINSGQFVKTKKRSALTLTRKDNLGMPVSWAVPVTTVPVPFPEEHTRLTRRKSETNRDDQKRSAFVANVKTTLAGVLDVEMSGA